MRWMRALRIVLFAFSCLVASPSLANVVTDWNEAALSVLGQSKTRVFPPRVMAMTEIAVFDAVNAVARSYSPYAYKGAAAPGASEVAAASEAAYRLLADAAPDMEPTLAAMNAKWLAAVTDPAARAAGVSLGDEAARAIEAARKDDNFDASVEYTPGAPAPGVYQKTAPGDVLWPHLLEMRPFAFESAKDVLLPPPPPVDSPQFLRDLVETRTIGSATDDADREGYAIAKFHERPGIFDWSAIGRQMIVSHDLDLVDSARAMALLEIAIADSLSVGYGAKYFYNFWRPVTAIHAGGAGFGHPEIVADPDWKPRIETPKFPEYPCMHCGVGAASSTILERLFPDRPAFKVAVPGRGERAFRDFRQFADEEAESRLIGGVHFRWSVVAGAALGESVAKIALKTFAATP